MFVAKKKNNTFMPRARLFRYGRLFEFELFIMDSWFFFIIIDFDQIKLWFSQKRFSAIGSFDFAYNIALLQIPHIFISILYI